MTVTTEDEECRHGMDARWCGFCKRPVTPAKPVRATKETAPKGPLDPAGYGYAEGTTIIDQFKGPNGFLSNFGRSPIEFEGDVYPTVEHAFQAAKTSDPAERADLRATGNPLAVKGKGKRVKLRQDWEHVKFDVMEDMLRKKFTIPALAEKLLATGDTILIEGNHWGDRLWGMTNYTGQNRLGIALMAIRDELRHAAAHRPT